MYGSTIGAVDSRCYDFEYFTSAIYPFSYTDELKVKKIGLVDAKLWGFEDPELFVAVELLHGSLEVVIAYLDLFMQNDPGQPGGDDKFGVYPIEILGGSMPTVIAYKNFSTPIDSIGTHNISVLSGTLVVVIAYINYTTGLDDLIGINPIQIVTGSLT